MRYLLTIAVAICALAVPSTAFATHESGPTCGYTDSQEHSETAGPITVYADTDGESGSSGDAEAAAGACATGMDTSPTPDGGVAEAGICEPSPGKDPEAPGAYAVIDGNEANSDPASQSDGYMGMSNCETGEKDPDSNSGGEPDGCSDEDGSGTNSGGCIGPDGGPWIAIGDDEHPPPVPTPICGNTTGAAWDDTTRDGCSIP